MIASKFDGSSIFKNLMYLLSELEINKPFFI